LRLERDRGIREILVQGKNRREDRKKKKAKRASNGSGVWGRERILPGQKRPRYCVINVASAQWEGGAVKKITMKKSEGSIGKRGAGKGRRSSAVYEKSGGIPPKGKKTSGIG